ncbi:MAG: cell division protein FtsA [Clostridiaceae bacterium]|nr:cell division protein FtsA [Clostridiaceae bacterium]
MADSSKKIASGKTKGNSGPPVKQKKAERKGRIIKLTDAQHSDPQGLQGLTPDNAIFAMDIGTRTVVGVIGMQDEQHFRIIATEVCAHKSRSMIDGQVHDIEQVASTAAEVKNRLEARIGFKLKKVAIAAAGRVLRTSQVRVEKNLEQGVEIDQDFVSGLEIEGIQRAQMMLDDESAAGDKAQFYCVGYSVINYYLNGYVISKLTGHKGKTVGADLLATFLPLIVVDSLYSVVNRIGLEVASLTLEPIAAINAVIPPDLRLLNLALVDIGAGTSDIALTREGSVFAYAMTSMAGDEITERIAQRYLVDFPTGEKIKTALSSKKENVTFTDIMKTRHTIAVTDILSDLEETIRLLASTISQKILEFNGRAPNAVFLIGGGSRIPLLPKMMAQQLGLPEDRVAVRSRDVIKGMKYDDKRLSGPESITPYGIAVTARMYSGKDFLSVTVNERKIKLFNSKKLTTADALIIYGFDAQSLIGRSGRGVTFSVNDNVRRVRGEHGKAAEIFLNGKPASLDTPLAYGDKITVIPAVDGKNAVVKAYELTDEYYTGSVKLNGNSVNISTLITINGVPADKDTLINDGDIVEISRIKTLGQLLEAAGFTSFGDHDIRINGVAGSDPDHVLRDMDQIICSRREEITEKSVEPDPADIEETTLYQQLPDTGSTNYDAADGDIEAAVEDDADCCVITVNGKATRLKNGSQHIFVDVFNYIEFDLSKPQGTIALKLNGKPAAFTDRIKHGDNVEIYWKK